MISESNMQFTSHSPTARGSAALPRTARAAAVWSQRWWLSAVCLVVPACASSAEQENVMSDGGLATSDPNEVHGFVTTSSDGPLAAATVTLDTYVDANTPGTTAGTTTSDSTGKYRFSNVTPGQYQIIVD
jgi:hypothetical protein